MTRNDRGKLTKKSLNRRELLTRIGEAAVASTIAGATEAEARANPPKPIILVSGAFRYECVHDWLTPPPDIEWGDTHGIAIDSHERIYIAHTVGPNSRKGDAILVFDRHGRFLKSWGERFRGGAHGLDLRRENGREYLYHCDINRKVFAKTDLDGNLIWEKGTPMEAGVYKDGAPFNPTNIALADNGDFYVSDGYGSSYIHQYNIKGEYIRTFGGPGTEPGKLQQPHGIWVDKRGSEPLLVVADRANNRLQYFTLDGKHVGFVTNGMRLPCHFHVRGELLLVPDLDHVVTILDGKNQVAVQLGDGRGMPEMRGHPRSDFPPGKFIHPHSAKFISNSDILVVEWVPIGRVTLLRRLS